MYRHFAVLTLVISLSIAMFADGENRERITSEVEARNQKADLKRKEQEKFGATPLVDKRSTQGSFGSEAIDSGGSSDSAVTVAAPIQRPAAVVVEHDPRALAAMSPQQRAAYLRAMEEEKRKREEAGPYQPTAAEIQALRAASAARSGSSPDDD